MSESLKWIDGERIRCVSCRRWVGLISVRKCDGYCPICNGLIDLDDEPYENNGDD